LPEKRYVVSTLSRDYVHFLKDVWIPEPFVTVNPLIAFNNTGGKWSPDSELLCKFGVAE
jgi:hypothetical protein